MSAVGRSHSHRLPLNRGLGHGDAVAPHSVPEIPGVSPWGGGHLPKPRLRMTSQDAAREVTVGLPARLRLLICCLKHYLACSDKSFTTSGVCGKRTQSV